MNQGQCIYSGWTIPRGKGISKVCNDNKIILTRNRKERSLMEFKISSRDVKWTESSRAFFKKTHKAVKEEKEFVPITKIVRGFGFIPKSLMESVKPTEIKKKEASPARNEKLAKNANFGSFRK